MLEWMKRHQRWLSLGIGSLFLIIALAMLFWSNGNSVSREEQIAQANIERMEARMRGESPSSSGQSNKALEQFYESRQQQMQYLLIAMIISGIALMAYGIFNKKKRP
jgi:hypothetical protein